MCFWHRQYRQYRCVVKNNVIKTIQKWQVCPNGILVFQRQKLFQGLVAFLLSSGCIQTSLNFTSRCVSPKRYPWTYKIINYHQVSGQGIPTSRHSSPPRSVAILQQISFCSSQKRISSPNNDHVNPTPNAWDVLNSKSPNFQKNLFVISTWVIVGIPMAPLLFLGDEGECRCVLQRFHLQGTVQRTWAIQLTDLLFFRRSLHKDNNAMVVVSCGLFQASCWRKWLATPMLSKMVLDEYKIVTISVSKCHDVHFRSFLRHNHQLELYSKYYTKLKIFFKHNKYLLAIAGCFPEVVACISDSQKYPSCSGPLGPQTKMNETWPCWWYHHNCVTKR